MQILGNKSKPKQKGLSKPDKLRLDIDKIEGQDNEPEFSYASNIHKNLTTKKMYQHESNYFGNPQQPDFKNIIKNQAFEGLDESFHPVISKQIHALEPSEIDEMVKGVKTEKTYKAMKDKYFKVEKTKNDTFRHLQRKLQEPLQLSDMKHKRKKNRSTRPSPINKSTTFATKYSFNMGSKNPFRETNERHIKKQNFKLK